MVTSCVVGHSIRPPSIAVRITAARGAGSDPRVRRRSSPFLGAVAWVDELVLDASGSDVDGLVWGLAAPALTKRYCFWRLLVAARIGVGGQTPSVGLNHLVGVELAMLRALLENFLSACGKDSL